MKTTLLLSLFILCKLSGFCQTDAKSEVKTGIWTLTLPDGQDGPLVFTFNYEYQFTRECIGTSGCHANLTFKITNINVAQLQGNGYGFRYNGKSYFCNSITQKDQRGTAGFDDIQITSFTIDNLIVYGGDGGQRFNMGTSMGSKWKAVNVSESTDLNKLILDFTLSRARDVNFTNANTARDRITNYLKPVQATTTPANSSGSPSAGGQSSGTTSGSWVTGVSNEAGSSNPSNNSGSNGSATTNQNVTSTATSGSGSGTPIEDEPMPDFGGKSQQQLEQERDAAVQNFVNTTGALIDMYASEAAEKREREYAEQQKLYDAAISEDEKRFEVKKENARITVNQALAISSRYSVTTDQSKINLIFFSDLINNKYSFYSYKTSQYYSVYEELNILLPDRQKWVTEAVENGNFDAILYTNSLIQTQQNVDALTIIAEKGCVDAMIKLAEFYDQRRKVIDGDYFGKDPVKAMYWLNEAAKKGCPKANYYLGMIYRYGYTNEIYKSYKVKYAIKKDPKLAFDYFSLAAQQMNYSASGYAKFQRCNNFFSLGSLFGNFLEYENGISIFTPKILDELALFYKDGKVVALSQSKADELARKSAEYTEQIRKLNFSEDLTDGFKYNVGHWKEVNNENILFDIDEVTDRYILETRKQGSYFSTLPVLDLTTDFSLRFQVKKNGGDENSSYGFVIGENTTSNSYHIITKVGEKEFVWKDSNGEEIKRSTEEIRTGRTGIGLEITGQVVKVKNLISGSATEKSGLIETGDIITKIEQADGKSIPLAGKTFDEIREMLIGKPGTTVKVTVKKSKGQLKTVPLVRAKASVLEDWSIYKVGNEISIWIDGERVFDKINVQSLYGNNFGFMISSGSTPCKLEIEDFMFYSLY